MSLEPNATRAAAIVGWPSPWIDTRSPRSIRIELNPYLVERRERTTQRACVCVCVCVCVRVRERERERERETERDRERDRQTDRDRGSH